MSNEIKMQFLGCRLMIGTSKSGKPYDMINMYYLVPAEANISALQTEHVAFGLETKDKPISKALFLHTQDLNIEPLSWVIVEIGIDPENIDRTIITSIKPVSANAQSNKPVEKKTA